jgi:hypothetical protein
LTGLMEPGSPCVPEEVADGIACIASAMISFDELRVSSVG